MKRFLAIILALCASLAFGATTVPVQLLNPSGSSSGQAIVSTGSSSAPAWGGPSASVLTGVTQYNVAVGGSTGLAFIGPGASGGFLISAGPSSYPAFGNTVSTLTATGLITPSGGIAGVTNGSAAAAGQVGQLLTATASAVSISNSTLTNCTSLNLTAGDWNVWGIVHLIPGASTALTLGLGGLSTTSVTLPASPNASQWAYAGTANFSQSVALPMQIFNVSGSTTVYAVVEAGYASGSATMDCVVNARRVR